MIPNKARGETVLVIDGAPRTLCLTLGALARLEAAFEVKRMDELAVRLGDLSASDLVILLAAMLDESPQALTTAEIDLRQAVRAVGEAFVRALS